MEWPHGKFLAILLHAHELCAIENKTGRLLGRFSYPDTFHPTALCIESTGKKACLALENKEKGAIFICNVQTMRGYRLPLDLPAPLQFTITPDFKHAYCSDHGATLYHIDATTLQCRSIARPEQAACVGLAIQDNRLYSAWESNSNGVLAVFSNNDLCAETQLDAVPTNLYLNGANILLPFTDSKKYGEGLIVIKPDTAPQYITVQNLSTPGAPRIYPCSLAFDETKQLAYLVHEDSGSISIIDTDEYIVRQTFSIGRSISHLHLLHDTRFALATSNMFADLALVDLINHRLLSINESDQEFSSLLAVIG